MRNEIQNIRLKFNCPANWEDMTPMAGGKFCDQCAKVVHNFTDAKQNEFAKILAENSGVICGRFRAEQMGPQSMLPRWKQWLSAAMLVIGLGAAQQAQAQKHGTAKSSTAKNAEPTKAEEIFTVGVVIESSAEFPGGNERLDMFINKHLRQPADNIQGRVFIQFKVLRDGSLSDFKVLRGLRKDCDEEALRVARLLPKWKPAQQGGKAIEIEWTMPIRFGQTN